MALLLLITLVAARGITKGEFSLNIDETWHAVTGLYFADFLRDLPLTHPIEYTFRYYAQYPGLGLLHWPPLFHFVEGIVFLVLGPSVVAARLTILFFSLLGFYFWFKLVAELEDSWTAAVCTVVLALHPSLLMYERSVMLEIPTLAMVVAASFFWVQYLKHGHQRHLWCSLILASLAVLTKYQAIYLGVFYVLSMLGERKWQRLRGRTVILAIGVSLLLLAPIAFLALKFHGSVLTHLAFARTHAIHPAPTAFQGLNAYAYYLEKLPRQLGWPLLALSIGGLLTANLWSKGNAITMLASIVACYLTMSVITSKEVRYAIYWLPPFVYFALAPLTSRSVRWRMYPLRTGIALALLLGYSVQAWMYQRPYVSGYEAAARCVIQRNGPPLVLFDGDLPGNFIFFMRSLDPSRRFFILRKSLYVDGAGGKPAVQLIESRVALEDFIQDYGVKSVIISEHNRLEFPVQRYLHQLLQTPEFRLIKQFPVETNDATLKCHHLMLYERASASSRSARTLTLKMPTLSRDITVSLDQPFGR